MTCDQVHQVLEIRIAHALSYGQLRLLALDRMDCF
jgi:hypothetical protein